MIFEGLEGDFSAVLGKFGADLGSLELFWFQVSFFCRFSAMLGKAWQQDGAKWTKLAASCGQDLPRWCQDGQLGHFVVSFGRISEQFWELFGVSFCGWVGIAKSMKTINSPSLLLGFQGSGE